MALRAFLVLLTIWAILAGVAFVAGVLPPFGAGTAGLGGSGEGEPSDDAATTEGSENSDDSEGAQDSEGREHAEGSVADGTAGDADDADDADDSTSAAIDADSAPPRPVPPTWTICSPDAARVSLAAVEVVSDARREVAIGCGPQVHVYAFRQGETEPVRVAILDASPTGASAAMTPLFAGPLGSMDVDGDGLGDLVAPFFGVTVDGDPRGGALFLIRRDAMGSFEAPVHLAPISATSVALAQLDGNPGFEILAANRGSDLARRASEVWVFNGGPSPARAVVLRAGVGDVNIAVADLDRDGEEDAIISAAGTDIVRIHFGDGTSHFPRTEEITMASVAELISGDLDGDGGEDVIIRANGLHLLAAGPVESIAARQIAAPATIHQIAIRDIDGDRKRDIVGIDGQRLVWLRQRDDARTFTEETLVSIEGAALQSFVLADIDGDDTTDLIAIGRAPAPGSPWSLVIVPDVREADSIVFTAAEATEPSDAPLTLRVPLR